MGSRTQGEDAVGRLRHFSAIAIGFAAAAGLWLLFVSEPSPHELILGGVSVLATMAFLYPVSRAMRADVTIRVRDLMQVVRLPWLILTGVAQVVWVLMKQLLGIERAKDLYLVCGFDSSKRDPVRKGRTVLAIAYNTMSPSSIVIGVDVSQSRMLFHQLQASEVPTIAKQLGARG